VDAGAPVGKAHRWGMLPNMSDDTTREGTRREDTQGSDRKRIPITVIVIAGIYLAVGIGGFMVHFKDLHAPDGIGMEMTELLAIVCGVFLLRAQNWARWLAIAWMTFHVLISFGVLEELAVHCAFLVFITWSLFRADANRFFRVSPGVS
jgi:hypothetical protein